MRAATAEATHQQPTPTAPTTVYAAAVGVLFDYFAAPTPQAAAATIDWVGGPSQPPATTGAAPGPAGPSPYRTVLDAGVDPVTQLGTLEGILTGRSFDEILGSHPTTAVAQRDGGQGVVSTVSEALVEALATASPDALRHAALPWSRTEEFWGAGDPEGLAELLIELADLARQARANGDSVYCWICV